MTRAVYVVLVVAVTAALMACRTRPSATPAYAVSPGMLTTGSLLLLSSSRALHHHITRCATACPITHVGMVVHDADNTPFVLHTTASKGACLDHLPTWLARVGAKTRVMARLYDGDVTGAQAQAAFTPWLSAPYTFDLWKAVLLNRMGVELPTVDTHTSDGLFCSQLIALVMTAMGMVDFQLSPRMVLPVHFLDPRLPFRALARVVTPGGAR
jgi:hypothetical protein